MKLIVGLGNPGSKYAVTRHNVGFLIIDELAKKNGIPITLRKYDSLCGKGFICDSSAILVQPQTFMNLSGEAVEKLVSFFKIEVNDLIVVHDDIDLQFNALRIKAGGGDGGHKGLRSIISCLGSNEFVRIRVGIGKPARKTMTERYVLECFSEDEMKALPNMVARACNMVEGVVSSGTQAAMNKYNVRLTKNLKEEEV